jgi:(p)ppGpp synthase/HD superfamily hydrolase
VTVAYSLGDALSYAHAAHAGQVRKGTTIPYISHPIAVCGLVLENGGDQDQAAAGLLHDVLEDCGHGHGLIIELRFGPRVLELVEGCTDGVPDAAGKKPAWRERKEAYLRHLKDAHDDVLLVSACDKLHNARAILSDWMRIGDAVFERFTASKVETRWYYWALSDTFEPRLGKMHPVVVGLRRALNATYA